MSEATVWLWVAAIFAIWAAGWVIGKRLAQRKPASLTEWLDAYQPPDHELKDEAISAIFTMAREPRGQGPWVWVMSQEWHDDLLRWLAPSSLTYTSSERFYRNGLTLVGLPVKVRDDAGFPKLVRAQPPKGPSGVSPSKDGAR